MLDHLLDVSIRSVLLALPAGIALWILRSRRTAALQHAVWATVVCGMLALLMFGQALPRVSLRVLNRPASAQPAIENLPVLETMVAQAPVRLGPVTTRRTIGWREVVVYVYAAMAFVFLGRFAVGALLVRRLIATSHLVDGEARFRESESIAVPLMAGWLRPRVLLPTDWRVGMNGSWKRF